MTRRWNVLQIAAVVAWVGASLAMIPTRPTQRPKPVFHVVALKFKEDTANAELDRLCRDFAELQRKIPQILSYNGGADIAGGAPWQPPFTPIQVC